MEKVTVEKAPTYDNRNRGILFTNSKKDENSPDYSGNLNVQITEEMAAAIAKGERSFDFKVYGRKKFTKAGPALSLSIKEKVASPF